MRSDESHSPILAGYDGSAASETALRWAVREAQLRYAPLVVCHAWHWPVPIPAGDSVHDAVRHSAEFVLGKAVSLARTLAPRLTVRPRLETGSPAAVLLMEAASAAAELIVVGTRGLGGFEGLPIGSTATQVAAYATRPVILVRAAPSPTGRIVVGVDGSPSSEAALAFALEEAALRRSTLHAVYAWDETDEALWREAGARFQRFVTPWCEKYPHVQVTTAFAARSPEEAVIAAGDSAQLVVVGDRAHRDPEGPPLGMVTQAVLHGAPCPVAVVHHR
jgi:nucleotide-binding universal stress UspA family protein